MTPPKAPLTDAALEGLEQAAGGCAPARRVVEMRIEDALALLAEVRHLRQRKACSHCTTVGDHSTEEHDALAADKSVMLPTVRDYPALARELAQALWTCGRTGNVVPEATRAALLAKAREAWLLGPEGGR